MNALRQIAFVALLALAPAIMQASELEIIPLRHRTVEQVIPVLRPLLEPGGTLTGMQNQLIVRASPANLAELKRVLASIDTPARRLLISVRQESAGSSARSGAGVRGNVGSGRVIIGNSPGGASSTNAVTIRAEDTRSAQEGQITQQIQVLEGSPAMIQTGQAVPFVSRTVTPAPGGAVVSDSVTYRDVTSGFEVVPRVAGGRVFLEISPRRDTTGASGTVNVQRIVTSASGRLGEWFELGGLAGAETRERSGLLSGSSARREDDRRVWVKVEEIGKPAR